MRQNPKVTINGGSMIDVGTVASVPHGSGYAVEMTGVAMTRVGKVFEERDPQLRESGLRSDTPPQALVSVLKAVTSGEVTDRGGVEKRAEAAGLAAYVSTAAGLAAVSDWVIKLRDSGNIEAVTKALLGS